MQTRILSIIIIAAVPVFGAGCSKQVSYNNDVKPILVSNCTECHVGDGEGLAKSGLSLKNYNSLIKGTKHGPVIVPGESESSSLYRLIAHKADPKVQMPPHHDESLAKGHSHALTPAEIETIKMWIDQGANNN